jgi:multidrug efflux pump
LEIYGDEVEMIDLSRVATEALAYLKSKNVAGIEELTQNISADVQQDLVSIDRDAARRYGISTYDIGMALRTSLFGNEVGQFKDGDDELPIMVRYSEMYRQNQDALMNQLITFRDMNTGKLVQVPIATVARINPSTTFNAIKRKNEKRTITITSNVLEGYNANNIVKELENYMKSYPMPEGFGFRFTGEQQEQAEAMAFLSNAFLYAMALVFFIIVLQFNSISSPLLIMTSILFSTIGVLLGYVITNMDLVIIMTGIGIISLAGIVVNNAIVLLDYVNVLLIKRRDETGRANLSDEEVRAAVIEAGKTRLRPVLLTAFTTVLGLIPLATGFNFDFGGFVLSFSPDIYWGGDNAALWGALSWTVVYGLIFATFLTLVIVPVMYWLIYRGARNFGALFAWVGSLMGSSSKK